MTVRVTDIMLSMIVRVTGILIAVSVGVALGVFLGGFLLALVSLHLKRSV